MLQRFLRFALVVALAGLVVLSAACVKKGETPTPGNGGNNGGSSEETTTPPAEEKTAVLVYLLDSSEKVVPVRRMVTPPAVAAGAMTELLTGPTAAEKAAGLTSAIPEGTKLLGVTVENRTAVVDLSSEYASGGGSLSMTARVAQVVFTLTQFSTVDNVTFKMNGQPITTLGGEGVMIDQPQNRANWEDLSPAVLVESPVFGDSISSPLRVQGTANVFEATFNIDVVDSAGKTVVSQHVTATSGTGTRGTFDVTITWSGANTGPGTLITWYESAQDGSRVEVARMPVTLK